MKKVGAVDCLSEEFPLLGTCLFFFLALHFLLRRDGGSYEASRHLYLDQVILLEVRSREVLTQTKACHHVAVGHQLGAIT